MELGRSESVAPQRRRRLPFHAHLQPAENAGFHDEVSRVEREPFEHGVRDAAAAEAPAREQARAPAVAFEHERPAAVDDVRAFRLVHDQETRRVDRGHDPTERLEPRYRPVGPHKVADRKMLPFRIDLVGVADVGADEPFESVMAVKAGAALPDLMSLASNASVRASITLRSSGESGSGAFSRSAPSRLFSSATRARLSALVTDSSVVSRISAASRAAKPSTSRRMRTARCLAGRSWSAVTKASDTDSRVS